MVNVIGPENWLTSRHTCSSVWWLNKDMATLIKDCNNILDAKVIYISPSNIEYKKLQGLGKFELIQHSIPY